MLKSEKPHLAIFRILWIRSLLSLFPGSLIANALQASESADEVGYIREFYVRFLPTSKEIFLPLFSFGIRVNLIRSEITEGYKFIRAVVNTVSPDLSYTN